MMQPCYDLHPKESMYCPCKGLGPKTIPGMEPESLNGQKMDPLGMGHVHRFVYARNTFTFM